ncbi:LLM class flavin-dependent oxidoreductase [Chitinophaga filiformis]|uniref:LLM class flavin-dependent oxidoreductase n=1 Tax=Chitinophaga filiformis TaxID=104663 RepID=UPI001F39C2E5|nr:LLM class flavin-dependent oxidoreductase [Chitinophaga filiformis]MCF6405202.1 LLM class flavin-dependent oxidoreductase [Chitinophaga filiformis]
MELGISSFGEITPERVAGKAVNAHKRVHELLEEIKLADEVGLDVFALGEHHRPDFVVSSPETILAAAAAITKRIKLSSSVTVLSSVDPVRTFQQFSTLDLISDGRAEIMAGRGSFIESFPLFGYDLKDYDALFIEKLDLLLNINQHEIVNWKGKFRPSIPNRGVYPRPIQASLPVWLAAGGTPASAVRAGKMNLPLTVAILGGPTNGFVSFAELYRKSAQEAGHDVSSLQFAISTHFFAADDSEQASDDLYPTYEKMMNRIGRERGWSPIERQYFEALRRGGPLMVGDVNEIIDKILHMHELYHNTRYLAQLIGGEIPHEKVMHAIELYGTQIAPAVRKALGS